MLLVDASMVFHRTFRAMDDLTTTQGTPTGMEYGTFRILEMLERKYPEQQTILCYDSPETWRKKQDARYKANRQKSDDKLGTSRFYARVNELKVILNQCYHHAEESGQEADDLLYGLALRRAKQHYIYTNDNDLLQAVREGGPKLIRVSVLKSHRNSTWEWNVEKVEEKFGVTPQQLPIYRAMIGDKSDNLEGVGRVDKDLIRECIRTAWRTKFDDVGTMEDFRTAFLNAITAYRIINRWTEKEWARIEPFLASGTFHRNLQLMELTPVNIDVVAPLGNMDLVREFMLTKEIRTLKICRVVMKDMAVDEEF